MGTRSYLFFGVIILLGVVWFGLYFSNVQNFENTPVTNFEECVAAGNPVLESYPRQCRDAEGNSYVENIGNELEKRDFIQLNFPRPNTRITSPLTLEGQARGVWYFEANFPIEIRDAHDNLVASSFATAQTSWMTEEFVPFAASVSFPTPQTETGMLILKKSNPSGLPQHDDELVIPVQFDVSEKKMISTVHFFKKDALNDGMNCTETTPVERTTLKTAAVARAALEELLKGLTMKEEEQGYQTAIPHDVTLQSIHVEAGTAYVDFTAALDENVAGSCTVSAIQAQIENTLKEFRIVEEVVISINSEKNEILQP